MNRPVQTRTEPRPPDVVRWVDVWRTYQFPRDQFAGIVYDATIALLELQQSDRGSIIDVCEALFGTYRVGKGLGRYISAIWHVAFRDYHRSNHHES